jgi:chemotaxis receptor (MCP) glutamine deamidase CheD
MNQKQELRIVRLPMGGVFASATHLKITTLLGSCVAACLYDPIAKVGGMNHILLPGRMQAGDEGLATRYGVHAMELLINRIMKLGGSKQNLRAKAFGGAKMLDLSREVGDVSEMNAEFVLEFLKRERIPMEAYHLGGTSAVTVWFEPVTAKAIIRRIPRGEGREVLSHEQTCQARIYRAAPRLQQSQVTLFGDHPSDIHD